MLTEHDEILIQRCIDNEATAGERAELLDRLEQTQDGWKHLACCFLEEQLVANHVRNLQQMPPHATLLNSDGGTGPTAVPHTASPGRPGHSVTNVVLSVCIAFVAGLLVRGQFSAAPSGPVTAQTDASGSTDVTQVASPEGAANLNTTSGERVAQAEAAFSAEPDSVSPYVVRLVEDGRPAGELPVFSAREYVQRSQRHWQELMRQCDRAQSSTVRTIWVNAPDGHLYVIPVEEVVETPIQ